MLPKLTNAVYNISRIVVTDDEQQVNDCIKRNLKSVNQMQEEMEKLRVDHPASLAWISTRKSKQINQAKLKVNEIFNELCDILNDQRRAVLTEIDDIASKEQQNDDDGKEVDLISLCTETIGNCTQFLKEEEKQYNTLISTNEKRSQRKEKILRVGRKVRDECQKTQNILKHNMNTIKRQIAANNALVVHFDFVVKSSARNTLTKYVRKLGMIKNKTYNSDQERMDDEYVDSEDDEVIIQRLKQQLEAKNCVMDGKSRVIEELKSDKLKQQQTVQELQRIHVKDIRRLKQQLDAQIQALETNGERRFKTCFKLDRLT